MDHLASRQRHRRRSGVALIVLMVLVVSLVVAASLVQRSPNPARRAQPSDGRTANAHPNPSGRSPSPAPMTLPKLTWADFYGVELPTSPTAGPRHQRNGLAWGFADSPAGALLAAVNIGVRADAQWGPGIFAPTIRRQMTGLGTGALLAACQASYAQEAGAAKVTGGRPLGRGYVIEQAYRWVAYTPADATVDIVSAGPGPQGSTVRAVTRIEVQWARDDWRVIAPPGGDWGNSAAPVASLRGYISFPGQP